MTASRETPKSADPVTARIKEQALALGADLVGVTGIDRLDGAPDLSHPARYLPDVRSVVVLARRIHRGTQKSLLAGASSFPFALHGTARPKAVLEEIAFDLSSFIEDLGMDACPLPSGFQDFRYSYAEVSHKHMAAAAGLGVLGKHSMLVTPEFGGAQRLCSILVSAELEPDPLMEGDPCAECPAPCIETCPIGAIEADCEVSCTIAGRKVTHCRINKLKCLWAYGGLSAQGTSALSDVPMPTGVDEYDLAASQFEFITAARHKNPWQAAMQGASGMIFCSRCYVVCHPEK